jgi:hypothetical protein
VDTLLHFMTGTRTHGVEAKLDRNKSQFLPSFWYWWDKNIVEIRIMRNQAVAVGGLSVVTNVSLSSLCVTNVQA